jgi:tetratricopeptide (TPR) repeat protein
MRILITILTLYFLTISVVGIAHAQDDEARQATGLPMLIGENATNRTKGPLSGKLTLQGLDSSQTKPNLVVIVYFTGAIVDRRQVNDSGYYYVPGVPREGAILAVEADGIEIGRYQLPSSIMGSIKQDIVINLAQVQNTKTKTGVLSAESFYSRTKENEKIFVKAVSSAKDKKIDDAIKLFKELVKNDSKDFVAWTELGTLFFNNEKFSEAEDAYNKALEQKPDFMVALVNLGKLFLAQKQPDKAIPVLTKAVEMKVDSADAQHYLGEAYLQAKKGSKAVVYLNEAIRLAPIEKAEIHLRLASLYNGAGLKDKAVEEYKMFLKKVPDYKEKEKIEKYLKENSPK